MRVTRGGQLEECKQREAVGEDEGGKLGDRMEKEGEGGPEIKNEQGRSVWKSVQGGPSKRKCMEVSRRREAGEKEDGCWYREGK